MSIFLKNIPWTRTPEHLESLVLTNSDEPHESLNPHNRLSVESNVSGKAQCRKTPSEKGDFTRWSWPEILLVVRVPLRWCTCFSEFCFEFTKFCFIYFIHFVFDLFYCDHLWDVKLHHVFNAIFKGNNWTWTAGARSLKFKLHNAVLESLFD